jgi:hypothetical protein
MILCKNINGTHRAMHDTIAACRQGHIKSKCVQNQPGTSGYQDTCPLDPGLMILGYQVKINPYILPIFTGSSHSIFNRVS